MTTEKHEITQSPNQVLHPNIAVLEPRDRDAKSGRIKGIWLPTRTSIDVWWVDPGTDPDGIDVRLCAMEHCLEVPPHPSIATVRAAGYADNGDHWVAIDRPPMRSLATVREKVDATTLVARARRLFEALVHLETHGIVHGDIGPGVISVDAGSGEALIGGFGPGTHAASAGAEGLGAPLEPGFASPERLAGHPLSPRSDLYSLSLTLYACFRNLSTAQARLELLQASGPLPAGLRDLFARMASENPDERPSSARRALAELELVSAEVEDELPDEESSLSDHWRERWEPNKN